MALDCHRNDIRECQDRIGIDEMNNRISLHFNSNSLMSSGILGASMVSIRRAFIETSFSVDYIFSFKNKFKNSLLPLVGPASLCTIDFAKIFIQWRQGSITGKEAAKSVG